MSKLRIVAMDGGGVLSILSLSLLGRMADLEPTLLDRADVWCGNSAGAINALRMAMPMSREQKRAAIDECIAFWWNDFVRLIRREPCAELAALAGCLPLYTTERLHAYLAKEFYRGARLRDLSPVAVTALKLDSAAPDTIDAAPHMPVTPQTPAQLMPQVIHNFGAITEHDGERIEQFAPEHTAANAALASAAAPIMTPIFANHLDGGLFANNPSMCTLVAALNAYQIAPSDVVILSLGTGANPRVVETTQRYEQWGYRAWLLDPERPLLLLTVLIDAITATVDYQCRNLLTFDTYVRINPPLPQEVDGTDRKDRAIKTALEAAASVSDGQLRAYLARLRAGGWFSDDRPPLRTEHRFVPLHKSKETPA